MGRFSASHFEFSHAEKLTGFTAGKGQYGEGDKFSGVSVPMQRAIADKYHHLKLDEIENLLANPRT
jgi:hypothetical protein